MDHAIDAAETLARFRHGTLHVTQMCDIRAKHQNFRPRLFEGADPQRGGSGGRGSACEDQPGLRLPCQILGNRKADGPQAAGDHVDPVPPERQPFSSGLHLGRLDALYKPACTPVGDGQVHHRRGNFRGDLPGRPFAFFERTEIDRTAPDVGELLGNHPARTQKYGPLRVPDNTSGNRLHLVRNHRQAHYARNIESSDRLREEQQAVKTEVQALLEKIAG